MAAKQNQPQVPVYLFTGFLEAGKTQYIQETLEDPDFNEGERTLLLLCEEGEEEYAPARFAYNNVVIETLAEESQLTVDLLRQLQAKHLPQRVIVEYNGMWMLDSLYAALPEDWAICQEFMFADATTFPTYNANMRQLVFDKLSSAELVIFNRFQQEYDQMDYHKLVRGASRGAAIIYEYADGDIQQDEIADPLPFDLNAEVIQIQDEDYAIWYRDISEEMDKYAGKKLRFRVQAAGLGKLPAGYFIPGRFVMTCCVQDIRFAGFLCKWPEAASLRNKAWYDVTVSVKIGKHKVYKNQTGPLLTALSVSPAEPADQEVATFY